MIDVLEIINQKLTNAGISYEYGRFTSELVYPYWVGEYIETPIDDEGGRVEADFIITGTTRNNWLDLETDREKIEQCFPRIEGNTTITEDGNAVVIFYANAQTIPTDIEELKRLEITLTVKKWQVK